jgi:hypothetical protein
VMMWWNENEMNVVLCHLCVHWFGSTSRRDINNAFIRWWWIWPMLVISPLYHTKACTNYTDSNLRLGVGHWTLHNHSDNITGVRLYVKLLYNVFVTEATKRALRHVPLAKQERASVLWICPEQIMFFYDVDYIFSSCKVLSLSLSFSHTKCSSFLLLPQYQSVTPALSLLAMFFFP